MAVLDVAGLSVIVEAAEGPIPILNDISFTLTPGESLGLVGESGSGKSMMAHAIMGLLPDIARTSGEIRLDRQNLLSLDDRSMSDIRGRRLSMIFQEPMTALNPVMNIGRQIAEPLRHHLGISGREGRKRAEELLDRVGLPPKRFSPDRYPHELSGGQRQRVVIAMALACGPEILIADEPTTALDVTTQSQILDLLVQVADEENMSLLMITHDLGVIAEMTDRMMVMYAGGIIEEGPTESVFRQMSHPYTRGLFAAMPTADLVSAQGGDRFSAIPGEVPLLGEALTFGCPFAPRCHQAEARCRSGFPPPVHVGNGHEAACFKPY